VGQEVVGYQRRRAELQTLPNWKATAQLQIRISRYGFASRRSESGYNLEDDVDD